VNKTSALENAETSAVGRALGFLGIGIVEGLASADEVVKAGSTAPVSGGLPDSHLRELRVFCDEHRIVGPQRAELFTRAAAETDAEKFPDWMEKLEAQWTKAEQDVATQTVATPGPLPTPIARLDERELNIVQSAPDDKKAAEPEQACYLAAKAICVGLKRERPGWDNKRFAAFFALHTGGKCKSLFDVLAEPRFIRGVNAALQVEWNNLPAL